MIVAVTGASGFAGSRLTASLAAAGHTVRPLPRPLDPALLEGVHAAVHLAGEPIAQRWTAAARRRILESRVAGTRALVAAMASQPALPRVLVSASAVGYYGDCGAEELTEDSGAGRGFLAGVCRAWEEEALRAAPLGVRVVLLRTGMVLGPEGGALRRMLPFFRLGLGGPSGTGRQYVSWIHAADLANLILFALENPSLRGPLNATAPHPVTNAEFAQTLARTLRRPAMLRTPAFALRLLFGAMSSVLLESQRALPAAALQAGFRFRYPELPAALASLFEVTGGMVS